MEQGRSTDEVEGAARTFGKRARENGQPKRAYQTAVGHVMRAALSRGEPKRAMEELADALFHPTHVGPIGEACRSWKDPGAQTKGKQASYHRQIFVLLREWMREDVLQATQGAVWILKQYVERHGRVSAWKAAETAVASLARNEEEEKGEKKQHTYPFAVWVELVHPVRMLLETDGETEPSDKRERETLQSCGKAIAILLDAARDLGLYKPSNDPDRKQLKYLESFADALDRISDRQDHSTGTLSATNAAWIALLRLEPRTVSNRTETVWSTLWKAGMPGAGSITTEQAAARGNQVLHVFAEIRQVDLCLLAMLRSVENNAGDEKLCQVARQALSCSTLAHTATALLSALAPTVTASLVNECTKSIPGMFEALRNERSLEHSRVLALLVCKIILQSADKGVGGDVMAARTLLRSSNQLLRALLAGPMGWLGGDTPPAAENMSRIYLGLHLAMGARELILRCRRVCLEEVEELVLDLSPRLLVNIMESTANKQTELHTAVRMIALSCIFRMITSLAAEEATTIFTVLDNRERLEAPETRHRKALELLLRAVRQTTTELCRSNKPLDTCADRAVWSTLMLHAPVWLQYESSGSRLPIMVLIRCMRDEPSFCSWNQEDMLRDCGLYTLPPLGSSLSEVLTHPAILEIAGVQASWQTAAAESLRIRPTLKAAEISISVPVGFLDSNAVCTLFDLWEIGKFCSMDNLQVEDVIVLNNATRRMLQHVGHAMQAIQEKERFKICNKAKLILLEQFEIVRLAMQESTAMRIIAREERKQVRKRLVRSFIPVMQTGAELLLSRDCTHEMLLNIVLHLDSWISSGNLTMNRTEPSNWEELPASAGMLLSCASLHALSDSMLDIVRCGGESDNSPAVIWTEHPLPEATDNRVSTSETEEQSSSDGAYSEDDDVNREALTAGSPIVTRARGDFSTPARAAFDCVDLHLAHLVGSEESWRTVTDAQHLSVTCIAYLLGGYGSLISASSSLQGKTNAGSLLLLTSRLLFQQESSPGLDNDSRALLMAFVTSLGCSWCTRKPQPPSTVFSRLLTLFIRGLGESSSEESSNLFATSFKQLLRRCLSPQWMVFIPTVDALLRQGPNAPKAALGCLKLLPFFFSASRQGRVRRYVASNVPNLMEAALCSRSLMDDMVHNHALILALRGGVSFSGVSLSTPLLSRLLALPSSILGLYSANVSERPGRDQSLIASVVEESATLLRLTVKNHFNAVHRCIPVAINTVRVLMHELARLESDEAEALMPKVKVAAQSVSRLFEELALLRQELGRYYPHVLADYIELAALASLDPLQVAAEDEMRAISADGAMRTSLSFGPVGLLALRPGILALLDACPAAERQMLHIGLPGGAQGARRATLQRLRVDYETSYRYTGKV